MIPDVPEKSIWVDIPETCRIRGEFTGDYQIQIMFGNTGDGVNILFERLALERFAQLATELLAVPIPDDTNADLPMIHAPG